MRVLIVGINGFLGRAIAKECRKRKIIVEGIIHKNINYVASECRIYPISQLNRIHDDYDAIFIAAADIPYPRRYVSDVQLIETNVLLPLQIALKFPESFIVFASSVSVYGFPSVSPITERTKERGTNKYGMTKLTAELLLTRYHKKTAIIRFSSIYGKDMYPETFIPRIIEDAKNRKIITLMGDGQRKQDYLHIDDAAVLCWNAARSKKTGKYLGVYGMSYSNITVAKYVCSHFSGCRIKHSGIDKSLSYKYDASYTKKQLEFVPLISLKKGIEKML